MGFGGEYWRGPNDGIGLVVVLDTVMSWNFEDEATMYVGYGPGPEKSSCTISSNFFNDDGSTLSSQLRYQHKSRSI